MVIVLYICQLGWYVQSIWGFLLGALPSQALLLCHTTGAEEIKI